MLSVVINWSIIGLSAFLWGWMSLKMICSKQKDLDQIMMFGLCFLTVYAEIFSLFAGLGIVAFLSVILIDVCIVLCNRKTIFSDIIAKKVCWPQVLGIIVLAAALIVLSAAPVAHYDSYLYHAQSIRWLEEYGVVPGLGNLHNRFAYNSAIFPVQALFSMKFLFGRSMHVVNGFVVLILAGYSLTSFGVFQKKGFRVSDLFRLVLLFFCLDAENCNTMSSPGSDHLALGLVFYIFVKWIDYWENREKDTEKYALLCILAVYAMSVKLSATMVVLLALYPGICFIKHKEIKTIWKYVFWGSIVILPFLIRNVIISGYLLYPYPEIDLFAVDWKMPSYTLFYDRNEIKAWGWGLKDVYRSNAAFQEWFPVWKTLLGPVMLSVLVINAIIVIPMMIVGVIMGIKKQDWNYFLLVITSTSCLLLWFFGAPLPRYGKIFLLLLPTLGVGSVGKLFVKKKMTIRISNMLLLLGCILCLVPLGKYCLRLEHTRGKAPDYNQYPTKEAYLEGEIIYVPVNGDQVGYYVFPSTPYEGRLSLIELRGNGIKDGFKMKEEFRKANVTTYGGIDEVNIFEKK